MKFFFAALNTETNTFSDIPTTMASFERGVLLRGEEALHSDHIMSSALRRFEQRVRGLGAEVVIGTCAFAQPGAPMSRGTYAELRGRILHELREHADTDIVLLYLHGATVADGCEDCEGDLIAAVRALLGPDKAIGAVLDPHAHLSEAMTRQADILSFMKEYPHADGPERIDDVIDICVAIHRGGSRPVARVAECRMVNIWPTQNEPMAGFNRRMQGLEKRDGIASISFVHGFPWGDTTDTGARMLVYADAPENADKAQALAQTLAQDLFALRGQTGVKLYGMDEALEHVQRAAQGPVVLVDMADNPGGGAPSDASYLLEAALARGQGQLAFANFYDPELVRTCHRLGVGARQRLRIGGKIGACSGKMLELDCEVRGIARDAVQMAFAGTPDHMGDTAWIHAHGIDIVLTSLRTQCFDPAAFSHLGIAPLALRGLVVKSTNHFYAGFAPIAREILYVATPGALTMDFAKIDYRRMPGPYWPRVQDPFAGENAC